MRAPGPWPCRMVNPIRDYDWGSTTTLAALQGRVPTGRPEAELWMGAHASAPSLIGGVGLDTLIADRPQELLGDAVHRQFGPRLPFLLKILAIARPLSLQVHPTAERARAAFTGQTPALGGHRYVDPYAKPELIYALEPLVALSGFRPAGQSAGLFALLDGGRAATVVARLTDPGLDETSRLEGALRELVGWPDADRAALAADVGQRSRAVLDRGALDPPDRQAFDWVGRLWAQFPADPMVCAPLLLDLVRLGPGEVMFVPAGAPHAYLHGTGVEIMASSDNVLRAGLTHKPVAVQELLQIVDGDSRPVRDLPAVELGRCEVAWAPSVPDFRLGRVRLPDGEPVALLPVPDGPQVLACTAGPVSLTCGNTTVAVPPAGSAFVAAGAGPLTATGPGELFRATVGG